MSLTLCGEIVGDDGQIQTGIPDWVDTLYMDDEGYRADQGPGDHGVAFESDFVPLDEFVAPVDDMDHEPDEEILMAAAQEQHEFVMKDYWQPEESEEAQTGQPSCGSMALGKMTGPMGRKDRAFDYRC
ncbi:hypothetical protein ACFL0K_02960 [Patescibacteria group bacterium]